MTPEQVADLVQRARETSTPEKSHPDRWERYRAERWSQQKPASVS
jgi:hypothetical protein